MLKKVLLGLVVVVVAAVGFVATRPSQYRIERSAVVTAPPDVVFARLNGFKSWDLWSPWSKLDPQMKTTFEGPETGKGARYAWDSAKDDVGAGNMTIVESLPPSKVAIDLKFTRPFESQSLTTFTLAPEAGDKTKLTWSMDGENNLMGKAFALFVDMDAMVGKDFEQGLAELKALAEKDMVEAARKKALEEAAAKMAAAAAETATAPTGATETAPAAQ